MRKYTFHSNKTVAEISSITNALPPINLASMYESNSFFGEVKRGRIRLGRNPNTLFSNITFFCGKISVSENETIITGHFQAPLKLVIIPYSIICVFALIVGGATGFLAGVVACALVHILQRAFLSINTQSKKDILSFIAENYVE